MSDLNITETGQPAKASYLAPKSALSDDREVLELLEEYELAMEEVCDRNILSTSTYAGIDIESSLDSLKQAIRVLEELQLKTVKSAKITRSFEGKDYSFFIYEDNGAVHVVGNGDKKSIHLSGSDIAKEEIVDECIKRLFSGGKLQPDI